MVVEKCPGLMDFFGYKNNQMFNFVETINIYNFLELHAVKTSNHHVNANDNDNDVLVRKAIKLFLAYTNIKDYRIFFNIIKNIPVGLKGDIADALGVILALNVYFKTGLDDHDIKLLLSMLDEKLLLYFDLLKRSDIQENNMYNLLVIPNDKTQLITLDYLKEFLEQYKARLVGFNDDASFVLSFDNHHDRFIVNSLLKESGKVKTLSCKTGSRFLSSVKYI